MMQLSFSSLLAHPRIFTSRRAYPSRSAILIFRNVSFLRREANRYRISASQQARCSPFAIVGHLSMDGRFPKAQSRRYLIRSVHNVSIMIDTLHEVDADPKGAHIISEVVYLRER